MSHHITPRGVTGGLGAALLAAGLAAAPAAAQNGEPIKIGFSMALTGRAKAEGVDPLGSSLGGWGYAYLQVLGEAVEGAKSINDDKVADYLRSHEFHTIMADIKFGDSGEWTKSRMMQVQYHNITDAADLETWRGMSYQTVLTPPDQKTGDVIYPYENFSALLYPSQRLRRL